MNCSRCDHPDSRHCKGEITHVSQYKGASVCEVVRVCVSRHCLNPLCSCVDFIAPPDDLPAIYSAPNSPAEIDAWRERIARDRTRI